MDWLTGVSVVAGIVAGLAVHRYGPQCWWYLRWRLIGRPRKLRNYKRELRRLTDWWYLFAFLERRTIGDDRENAKRLLDCVRTEIEHMEIRIKRHKEGRR